MSVEERLAEIRDCFAASMMEAGPDPMAEVAETAIPYLLALVERYREALEFYCRISPGIARHAGRYLTADKGMIAMAEIIKHHDALAFDPEAEDVP